MATIIGEGLTFDDFLPPRQLDRTQDENMVGSAIKRF